MNAKLVLSLIAVLLVAGCAQYGGQQAATTTTTLQGTVAPEGAKEFNVTVVHTFYNPSSFAVNKGDTVRFLAVAATGQGFHNHGIAIDEYGINQAVTTEDTNNPVKIEFVADKAGTFRIYCKTCWDGPFGRGHPDIQATLVVK
ncbi:cupredoxin domain-containing protein [Candidatus Woesearchaeota archaeon]|nr:cupredoxin domain-containing protein [Candidatus Woesearchaeota archaeon]